MCVRVIIQLRGTPRKHHHPPHQNLNSSYYLSNLAVETALHTVDGLLYAAITYFMLKYHKFTESDNGALRIMCVYVSNSSGTAAVYLIVCVDCRLALRSSLCCTVWRLRGAMRRGWEKYFERLARTSFLEIETSMNANADPSLPVTYTHGSGGLHPRVRGRDHPAVCDGLHGRAKLRAPRTESGRGLRHRRRYVFGSTGGWIVCVCRWKGGSVEMRGGGCMHVRVLLCVRR